MKWFKHDSDANRDAKLKKVIIKYGMAGYGLYWFCLEEIASNITENKFTFELESDSDVIARDTGINSELVAEMMTYMVNLKLFENQEGLITCLKMLSRLDQSMTSNAHMRNIISSAKTANNHDKIMTESSDNHDPVMTKSCKSREDKIRLDQIIKEKKITKEKVKKKKETDSILKVYFINEDVSEQVVNDFIAHRKNKKALITETAMDGIKREADKAGVSLETALKECCERGWIGFKADWYLKPGNQSKSSGRDLAEEARRSKALKLKLYPNSEKDITP